MKFSLGKMTVAVLAGVFAFGVSAACVPAATAFAAHHETSYEDGTSNVYSHRMKEESDRHESTVRAIRHEYRRDGDRSKYERRMKEEQHRHDAAMEEIRHDYNHHR